LLEITTHLVPYTTQHH